MTVQKVIRFAFPIVFLIISLIGALIYWLGAKVMGGTAGFLHAFSIWIYSSLPPTVIGTLANFLVLFLKSPDDIDIATSSRGLVKANPTLLFDGKEMPVLATVLSTIDLFVIWGLVLAAIGMQKVAKLSAGSAWGIVLIITLIGLAFRVLFAFLNGVPQ